MIFVTGATGFLGSYLAKNLINQGFKVRAFKRPASNFDLLGEYAQRIEWVAGDLLDLPSVESALQGIEKIYHCAGIVAPRMSERRKAVLINTEGSANLYNAALVSGVKKALHVSSTMALGRPVNAGVISENHNSGDGKKQPVYIESKRLGELEAWRTDAEGLPVVIVNPAGIIGAGKWQHEPLNMFPTVANGLSFYTSGSNGFVDVRDAVEVMIQLMESEIHGERFIIAPESIMLKDIISSIAGIFQVKEPKYMLNNALGELAWMYEDVRAFVTNSAPRFSRDDLQVANMQFSYSNKKVEEATGHKFRSIAASLAETCANYLESKKKGLDYATFY